ncbi:acyltransferase [Olleya namhaensis]|uniref:acyltransferase n=1 Tax=Olleya namhaensis TaxID=1144750 RepID=UPI0024937635|nr:acyltransferase [Olleya namhaensis]
MLQWRFFLKHVGAKTKIYRNVIFNYPNNVSFGSNCLVDKGARFASELKSGELKIADNVQINRGVYLDFTGGVIIEDNVLISKDCYIISHSHGYDPRSKAVAKPLRVARNVWIGAKVLICENVNVIGENSIIAAGAVVTKNVEPNSIYGGNPAKKIKDVK